MTEETMHLLAAVGQVRSFGDTAGKVRT